MYKTIIALAAITITAFANTAHAFPAGVAEVVSDHDSRNPSIETIIRNWDQYGFSAPTKPTQMRVNGRNGISISGSDYATAISILRQGVNRNDGAAVRYLSAPRGME